MVGRSFFLFFPQSLTVKAKNTPQLFLSLSCTSAGWCRIRCMFALRFTPHQRQSSIFFNHTQKPGSYSASLMFCLKQKCRRGQPLRPDCWTACAVAMLGFLLAHVSEWLLPLSTSWRPFVQLVRSWKAVAWQHFLQIVITTTNKRRWLFREGDHWFQRHQ